METRGFFASFFWAERTIRPISRTLKLILRRLGIQGIPDAARLYQEEGDSSGLAATPSRAFPTPSANS